MGQVFLININIYFLNCSLWKVDLNPTDKKKRWPPFCIMQTLSANSVHIAKKNGSFNVQGVCFCVDTTGNKKWGPFIFSSKFWQKGKKRYQMFNECVLDTHIKSIVCFSCLAYFHPNQNNIISPWRSTPDLEKQAYWRILNLCKLTLDVIISFLFYLERLSL